MSDLAPIPAVGGLPAMSPDLRGWFLDDLDLEWIKVGQRIIQLPRYRARTPELMAEVRRILPAYRAACLAPTADFLNDWLKPLAVVSRNPVSAAALDRMAPIFAAALSTIPGGAFTRETWIRAMQTFKFWPSPADLAELVAPEANEIRRAVSVLQFIMETEA